LFLTQNNRSQNLSTRCSKNWFILNVDFVGHGTQKSLWMENLLDPSEHDPGNFTYTMNCNANDADINQTSSMNASNCHDDVAIAYEVTIKQ